VFLLLRRLLRLRQMRLNTQPWAALPLMACLACMHACMHVSDALAHTHRHADLPGCSWLAGTSLEGSIPDAWCGAPFAANLSHL
jgi:hypothetical protein